MFESKRKRIVGLIGGGSCDEKTAQIAYNAGVEIANRGYILICGGRAGVMEAGCRGAKSVNGITIGIIPGTDPNEANPYVDYPIITGLGIARNAIIAHTAHIGLAINGAYGTLSEIAHFYNIGKKVVGINTWDISEDLIKCSSPVEALEIIDRILGVGNE